MNEPRQLQLDAALGHEATDKRIDVLRRIDAVGSISEAARGAGISYKAAWQAIETLSNLAGMPLVEKAVGGSGGGGAQLTPAGHRILRAFDLLAAARQAVLAQLDHEDGASTPSPGLAALGLRTSMRNQLPCVVAALRRSGAAVRVELALSDDTRLAARITQESAQLLDLERGKPVLALCKAMAVKVSQAGVAVPADNVLRARVVRVAGAAGWAELSLRLDCGLSMVGFATDPRALKVGDACLAQLEESAVVIALTG